MRKSTIGKKLSDTHKKNLSIAVKNRKPPRKIQRNVLDDSQRKDILNILLKGEYRSILSIANQYNVSRKQIYNIIKENNIEIK